MERIERRFASLGCAVKYQFDLDRVDRSLHIRGGKARGLKLLDSGRDRFANRLRVFLAHAVAQNANPMPVLRQIGKIKKDAKRPGNNSRIG